MKIWTRWNLLYVVCFLSVVHSNISFTDKRMKMVHAWKSLEFDFPNEAARNNAIKSEQFIPGAPIPIDVDVYEKENGRKPKVFITVPRFQNGVPVTIGYVTNKVSTSGEPIIAPYPNWEWNKLGSCNSITSVFRVKVDSCKRIWILDTGKVGDQQVCPPQLLSFSLENDRLMSRYKFPRDQYKDDSLLVTPVVDIPVHNSQNKCEDVYVYIADVTGFALIVYNHRKAKSWKIVNKYFYPYPRQGTFYIKGESFDLMDGILGLALSPPRKDGDRILFFHSLASVEEGWVKTSIIRNETLFEHDEEAASSEFHTFNQFRSSQSAPQDVDKNGILYFGLMSDLAIACWNTNDFPHYGGNTIQKVVVNSNTLQFASGIKVISNKNGSDQLWVLTSSFQKFMSGTLKPHEINFRIQAAVTEELVRGSRCVSSSNGLADFCCLDHHSNHHHYYHHNYQQRRGHYFADSHYPFSQIYPWRLR